MNNQTVQAAINRVANVGRAAKLGAHANAFELAMADLHEAFMALTANRTAAANAARKRDHTFTLSWRSTGQVETFDNVQSLAERTGLRVTTINTLMSRGKGRHAMSLLPHVGADTVDSVVIERLCWQPGRGRPKRDHAEPA